MSQINEAIEGQVLGFKEGLDKTEIPAELAGMYNPGVLNDDLIRLYVRVFGWEINNNSFLFNKSALLAQHLDAFYNYIPAWKSFERQIVNCNHNMQDNLNSRIDKVIGFIEQAEYKEDGVYLTMFVWKRTLSEDQITQIRDGKVTVSMEVRYDKPLVIVDGKTYPPSAITYDPRKAVRTMSDDSTLSFIGIAVLFNGIKPGFSSAEVLVSENAALEDGVLVSGDTSTEVSMEKVELEKALAELQTQVTENAALAVEKETAHAKELADAQARAEAAEKIVAGLRDTAFTDALASVLDLSKLEAPVAEFAKAIFAAIDPSNKEAFASMAAQLHAIGECAACAPKKDPMKKEKSAEELAEEAAVEAAKVAADALAATEKAEADRLEAEKAAQVEAEAARVLAENAALLNLASDGKKTPQYSHRHL